MQITVVQTRLGTFNEYILRREDGLFLGERVEAGAGVDTWGPEADARRFADAEHAVEVANALEARPLRPSTYTGPDNHSRGA